jgi:HK97 family phage prohead protease
MNNLQSQFSFNLQFNKAVGTTKREIEGFASTSNEDRDGEYFPKELLEKAAQEYIRMGTLLFDHGNDSVYGRRTIGKLFKANVDEEGRMYVKGRVSDDYIWEKIELGELQSFSIGGKASWETREVGGRIIGVATSLEIFEVSIVSVPANPEALFSIAKSFELSYKEATDNLGNEKVYNKDITINKNNLMDEMFKNISEKIDGLLHSDKEKQELKKSIETLEVEKAELTTKTEELSAKVEELTKSLEDEKAKQEELKDSIKGLDDKLVSIINTKKKAKTDAEIEKSTKSTDIKKEAVNLAEETEKVYDAIFNR